MVGYTVIVPAAGQGKRMGAGKNKQFLNIGSKPLILQTIQAFAQDEWCNQIILVGNEQELGELENLIESSGLIKPIIIIAGGKERQQSVYHGIKMVEDHEKIVLIHDGARPFITREIIHEVVQKANDNGAATVAVPVKDTIKKVNHEVVEETLERSGLWAVQTPQAFRLSIVKTAHQKAEEMGFLGTDDASLVEYIGQSVHIVQGSYFNIKITTPEDLILAEAIIKSEGKEHD
jgi:2-C-methyl-D-erythritol 4-phosphate cytidylyltransferase